MLCQIAARALASPLSRLNLDEQVYPGGHTARSEAAEVQRLDWSPAPAPRLTKDEGLLCPARRLKRHQSSCEAAHSIHP